MILVFIMYGLFATVFTSAKMGLEHAEPLFLVGGRMIIAAAIMYPFMVSQQGYSFTKLKDNRLNIILLGFFNIYATNGLEFWGMKYLTSSKTSFIYSLTPFLSALVSYFVFHERLSKLKWLGLAIGFAGFIPILTTGSEAEQSLSEFASLSLAEGAVLSAAMCTVIGWVLMRKLVDQKIPFLVCNTYSMAIGGIMAIVHSLITETWDPIPIFGQWETVVTSTLWMTVVSSLICYNLYAYLLKKFSITFLSFSGFSTPFFTAIFSYIMINEVVTLSFLFSAVFVFFGLALFYYEEIKFQPTRIID